MKRKPTVMRVQKVTGGYIIQRKRALFGLLYLGWKKIQGTGPFGSSAPFLHKRTAERHTMSLVKDMMDAEA